MKSKSPEEAAKIMERCDKIAGKWSKALYRFLTDAYINHVYICMNFGIPRELLFDLKRKYYIARKKEMD